MKQTRIKKKLVGAITASYINEMDFVCLLSQIKEETVPQNCLTIKIPKLTAMNNVKLTDLLKEGVQNEVLLRSFKNENDYISYLSLLKDKETCFSFIKYKNYFFEMPKSNPNSWVLDNKITQKRILLLTMSSLLPIILPNILKDFDQSIV